MIRHALFYSYLVVGSSYSLKIYPKGVGLLLSLPDLYAYLVKLSDLEFL